MMKVFKSIIVVFAVVFLLTNCKNEKQPEIKTIEVATASEAVKELDPNATYAKAEFTIEGMTCQIGCANTIQKKIAKMEGVKSAKVDFERKLAMVEYDEAKVSPTSLTETVSKVADVYKVKGMKTVAAFSE